MMMMMMMNVSQRIKEVILCKNTRSIQRTPTTYRCSAFPDVAHKVLGCGRGTQPLQLLMTFTNVCEPPKLGGPHPFRHSICHPTHIMPK